MTSELMEIYTDDSGVGRPNAECFIMGMWLTWRPLYWRALIREIRAQHNYPYQLHFHKMGSTWEDRRYKVLYTLLQTLAKHSKTWYYRGMYVGPDSYPEWQAKYSNSQAVYDWAMQASAIRFMKGVPEVGINLIVEQRNRPKNDRFIPDGLEEMLRAEGYFGADKVIKVLVRQPAQDDLLQVADFFTSALRVKYHPGTNKCKLRFADALDWYDPVADRVRVWEYPKKRERAPIMDAVPLK